MDQGQKGPLFFTLSQFPGVRKSIRVYTPLLFQVRSLLTPSLLSTSWTTPRYKAWSGCCGSRHGWTTVTSTGRRVVSGGVQTAHAIAGESKGNIGLLEVLESSWLVPTASGHEVKREFYGARRPREPDTEQRL